MKPLLVGEQNPYQSNAEDADRYALYPEPESCALDYAYRLRTTLPEEDWS